MALMQINISDEDVILLESDTQKYNEIQRAAGNDELTVEGYFQMIVAGWFSGRHEERIEAQSELLKRRYKTDPAFKTSFDAWFRAQSNG